MKSLLKRLTIGILLLLLILIAVLLFNTLRFSSTQTQADAINPISIDPNSITRFAKALQIKTISHEQADKFDSAEFERFNIFLQQAYPRVYSQLEHRTFNQFSHLFTWQGSDSNLKPIVLMGHIDVVPIASPDKWSEDPFAGVIKNDIIWGRGTIDDKISVIATLEAVEHLLKNHHQPERTIYLAFGHDEEVSGELGAKTMAEYLLAQNIEAEFVLDEGYGITQGLIPDISKDTALIGIAEKGSLSLELSTEMIGGHSSTPDKETAIDLLANAVSKLKRTPLNAKLTDTTSGFVRALGPEMPFFKKMVFANTWLFEGIILDIYGQSASGNALIRTTTSPTIFNAGIKENVIPSEARAVVNFRIMPGENMDSVEQHVRDVIDDERIKLKRIGFNVNPSGVSPIDSSAYATLNKTIRQVYPDIYTAPNLVVGATDARHFQKVSPNVYRFVPYHINVETLNSFHGIDERISVEDYKNAIRFYVQLMKNAG